MTDEILDTAENAQQMGTIALFGKMFYVFEAVLWACLLIWQFYDVFAVILDPFFLAAFYLVLGSLFFFFSRAFPKIWDKLAITLGFMAAPILLAGIAFTFSSWPYGRELSILSPILGITSLAYIIVQLVKGTASIAVRHFRIMLIRLIPTVLIGVYIVYVTMR